MRSSEWRQLFQYRPYRLFFMGTSVSTIGNGMQLLANSWFALQLTSSLYSVSLVFLFSALPGALLSPFIGVLVDRFDRKIIAASMDLFRALILLSVAVCWYIGRLEPWHLYVMAFFLSLGDQIFNPATTGLIKEVVPGNLLLYANSGNQVSTQFGSIVGAGIGGIFISLFSPILVLTVNALTFFFSAWCIVSMGERSWTAELLPHVGARPSFFSQFLIGIHYLKQRPEIVVLYFITLSFFTTLRILNTLLPILSKEVWKVGATGFGMIDAAFAIGAILGSMWLPSLVKLIGRKQVMASGLILLSASLIAASKCASLISASAVFLAIGLFFQCRTAFITHIQQNVDVQFQGRVHSSVQWIFSLFSIVFYFLIGKFGTKFSPNSILQVQGVFVGLMCTGFLCFIFIKRLSQERVGCKI